MTTLPPDPQDSHRLVALTGLLKAALNPPSPQELDAGLNALRARLAAGDARQRRFLPWSRAAFATLCVLAVLGVAVMFHRRSSTPERALAVERVEGGKLLEGGYLSASGNTGVKLLFDEGSEFALAPGTRGRVRAVGADGAQLAVDQGTASFRITPSPRHRWSVEAGPFLVTVQGTEFTVFWDPPSERFEVRLKRGRVSVRGPVLGDELVLRPGQKLSVSLPRAELMITEDSADRSETPTPAPAIAREVAEEVIPAPVASGQPVPSVAGAAPAPAPSAPLNAGRERRWSAALANGQWDRILADVDRVGVEATLQSASSGDLFALADAARYRRRTDLAHAALLAHRRRFPDSPRSVDALFLLGRVEESRNRRALAIRWYDEYLARAPGGTYAAEALGRKMILTNATEGRASAQKLAAEYLSRFPKGSHAAAARALQRAP